ncbi:DUF2867 domain-containing protein [Mycobacterium sp. PDNC021]|uniref:DUF2867 domain-containing protein n=1 Tax=Mycobacterium sp. PDNC021 TaxID=3391399 RepID=UPI003AAE68D7
MRTQQIARTSPVDTTCAFDITRPAADLRTAEQWARSVFEGAPSLMRGFLLFGWRVVLGLPSRPRTDDSHVLGWHVDSVENDLVVLEQRSRLIAALNIVQVDDAQVSWTTTVHYRTPCARLVWAMVLPFHTATIPRLLIRAARGGVLR